MEYPVIIFFMLFSAVKCTCINTTAFTIDMSNHGITEVKAQLFTNCNPRADTLILTGNEITHINGTAFAYYDHSLQKFIPTFPLLTTLILDNNRIQFIDPDSFQYTRQLRTLRIKNNKLPILQERLFDEIGSDLVTLDLSHNFISSVSMSVFTNTLYMLEYVDMSFNNLTSMEAWPYIVPKIISFNLSHNQINKLTNYFNWTYNLGEPYHAHVDLRYNNFTVWNDEWLRQYAKPNGDFIGDFVTYQMDMTHNSWKCDCQMHYMASTIQDSFYKYAKSELLYVECENPENLRGQRILEIDPIKFVCDVKIDCPDACVCTNISETKHLQVNCKDGNMTELPLKLPDIPDRSIELDVSNNSIWQINSRSYVDKLLILKANNNRLVYIDQETVKNMTMKGLEVNISNNQLQFLPNSIQNIPSISFYGNQFKCDCNMTWMAGWLDLHLIENIDKNVVCTTDDGDTHKITDVTESLLDCNYNTEIGLAVGFGVLLVVVVIGIVWAKRCPYETKVLVFKFFRYHPGDKYKIDKERKEYDLYISFDDENIHIRQWVLRKLKKRLEDKKFESFVPVIDLPVGEEKGDHIVRAMENSKRVIIILSDKYDENEWCVYECQQAEMLNPNDGRIIFIKYHPEADDMILKEPWKSRVKDRKVLSIGEKASEHRWFWDKLKYELPVK